MKFSPTQCDFLTKLKRADCGGIVERRPGGFWTGANVPQLPSNPNGAPQWYVGTQTVAALAKLGVLVESKRQHSRGGAFIVEYRCPNIAQWDERASEFHEYPEDKTDAGLPPFNHNLIR